MSTVYETPQFANSTLRMVAGGWRISGIVRMLTGSQLQASTGVTSLGIAPNATDEVPRQILGSVYADDKTVAHYLNAAAFQAPVQGAYGPLIHVQNFAGPGSIRVDLGLVRTFNVTEGKTLEFRAEAFNAPNHMNPGNPVTTLTSPNLWPDPVCSRPADHANGPEVRVLSKVECNTGQAQVVIHIGHKTHRDISVLICAS